VCGTEINHAQSGKSIAEFRDKPIGKRHYRQHMRNIIHSTCGGRKIGLAYKGNPDANISKKNNRVAFKAKADATTYNQNSRITFKASADGITTHTLNVGDNSNTVHTGIPEIFGSIITGHLPQEGAQNLPGPTKIPVINNELMMVFCNLRSLPDNKVPSIECMLKKYNVDIFGVVEHKKKFKSELPSFQNYSLWSKCRENQGGGVAIWVKKRPWYKAYLLPTDPWPEDLEHEQLWVVMELGSAKLCIGCVYIRPQGAEIPAEYGQRFLYLLQARILELTAAGYEVCVMGDFNAKMKHPQAQTIQPDIRGNILEDVIDLCGLSAWNLRADTKGVFTRVPEGIAALRESPSLLDYVLYTGGSLTPTSIIIDESRHMGIESDHVPIRIKCDVISTGADTEAGEDTSRLGWNITHETDWGPFKIAVEQACRTTPMPELALNPRETIQLQFNRLKDIIRGAGIQCIGIKSAHVHRIRLDSRSVTIRRNRVKEARYQVGRAVRSHRHQDTIDRVKGIFWKERQGLTERLRWESKQRVERFAETLVKRNDRTSMNLYKYVRNTRRPVKEQFVLEEGGELVTDVEQTRAKLRHQWNEKIYNPQYWPDAELVPPPESLRLTQDCVSELQSDIELHEVVTALKELHPGTSTGTTDIPPELLMHAPGIYIQELLTWTNLMWKYKILPAENDTTRSTFLHKKGSTNTLDNYRTLATGCNLCKVYLRVLYNRVQGAVEESNLLGEIQNGFRKGRRATDNILVMETIIRKYKHEKKNLTVALLDITKAYDRICRETLWYKLKQYGFPDIIIDNLKAVYYDPKSTLVFQGIQTEPLEMKIGLRQGCVLSPILFALYIADLGRLLEESGFGAILDGRIIPAMMFADDIALMGSDEDLDKLCPIVKTYAKKNKLEFSGPKSSAITINRKPIANTKRWVIGTVPIQEREGEPIIMHEDDNGRYLGISWKRTESIFSPQMDLAIKKGARMVGILAYLIRKTNNPTHMLKKLWETYALPMILYGTEVMTVTSTALETLEVQQRSLIKNVFKFPAYTATVACEILSGLQPIKFVIAKRKINYLMYVQNCDDTRWVKWALQEQLKWARRDHICGPHDLSPQTANLKPYVQTYWLKHVLWLANEMNIPINRMWTKLDLKLLFIQQHKIKLQRELTDTLRYFDNIIHTQDDIYNSWYHLWWQKARTESMFLFHRKTEGQQQCPVCTNQIETLEHFLIECDRYASEANPEWMTADRGLAWMLSRERSSENRTAISSFIHKRWKQRMLKIEQPVPRQKRPKKKRKMGSKKKPPEV